MKKKLLRGFSYGLATVAILVIGLIAYVKFAMPNVAAAPYVEIPVTQDRIERGKYLAHHVAVCMDCHSTRDWSKFSGPLVEGTLGKGGEYFGPEMGFPGNFYSKNLTPVNLGDWTDGEIYRAITTGVGKDGKALFPVMPYPNYAKMDKEDIYDIIAYLRTLEPIENQIPASEASFPMNIIINTIPKDATPGLKPSATEKQKYGEYVANAAGCIECHTQVKNGQLISDLAFSGGREFKMPDGGTLRSANITPDEETGIGSWGEEAFVARFKAFQNPQATPKVAEGEMNTVMPWAMYAGMETSDLQAIYAYLKTLEPIENQVQVYSN